MKYILLFISMAFALNVWSQTPIQVQTQTKEYNLSDAYRITFEDDGCTQVVHTRSQGEIRIPMADLKQIHFNDTAISLANQIMALENCEIMKTILFDDIPGLPSEFFWRYLNSPNVKQVLIPNDDAFLNIPTARLPLTVISYNLLSVSLDKNSNFPLQMKRYAFDPRTGEKGRELVGSNPSQTEIVGILQRLIVNQFLVGSDSPAYTVAGSFVNMENDIYEGTYRKWTLQNGWANLPKINVIQQFEGSDGKICKVTDAFVCETCLTTYDALKEIAPEFLKLMEVPTQFLLDCGYMDAAHVADVTFFKDMEQWNKFCWTSSRVSYTIFAPTDEAIKTAINNKEVFTWDMIKEYKNSLQGNENADALLREKISKTLAFVKRHICFGNVLVDIPKGNTMRVMSCNMQSTGAPQQISITRDASSDGFAVFNAKSVPNSIRCVREPWKKNTSYFRNPFITLDMGTGVVMQINEAIANEY